MFRLLLVSTDPSKIERDSQQIRKTSSRSQNVAASVKAIDWAQPARMLNNIRTT
jgi:hypothetical protein